MVGRSSVNLSAMTGELRIPAALQASIAAFGDERADWLAALPARVEELAERWGLRLDDPFEPGGNCAWVAPGVDRHGRDVVLKVAWHHTEARHEAEGLVALAGHGAVELFRFEHLTPTGSLDPDGADTTAMLLERCRPGVELRALPEAQQHAVITGLLRQVWAVDLPPTHPFRPLSTMVDEWTASAERRLAEHRGRMDEGLARHGLALFRALARDTTREVLLATDLHAGNVLSSERAPWLIIDPKPYVGDPHYDVTQHLLNCESLRADPIGLSDEVAALAGLDPDRVRQWLFARCVQEHLQHQPLWPGLDVVLERLGTP